MTEIDFDSIRNYCLSKKLSEEDTPFGPQAIVFKVCGKMFALLSADDESFHLNLKNDPEVNLELREQYSFITPGYHMNKKHWNTVTLKNFNDQKLLFGLIDQSYNSVVAGLPKKLKNEIQLV